MKEAMYPQPSPRERASELVQTAARLRQWSRALRRDFVRLQRGADARGWTAPARGGELGDERKPDGARWMAFALALNWVALAIVDVERHRMAGLLGWYQAQEERGVTPADVAFLSGRSGAQDAPARPRSRRKSG